MKKLLIFSILFVLALIIPVHADVSVSSIARTYVSVDDVAGTDSSIMSKMIDSNANSTYNSTEFDLSEANPLQIDFVFPWKGDSESSNETITYFRFRCPDLDFCPDQYDVYANDTLILSDGTTTPSSVNEFVTVELPDTNLTNLTWVIESIQDDDANDNVTISDVEIYSTVNETVVTQITQTGFVGISNWWNNLQFAHALRFDDVNFPGVTADEAEQVNMSATLAGFSTMFLIGVDEQRSVEVYENVTNHGHEYASHSVSGDTITHRGYTYLKAFNYSNDSAYIADSNISNMTLWADNTVLTFSCPGSNCNPHGIAALYDAGFRTAGQGYTYTGTYSGYTGGVDTPRYESEWMVVSRTLGSVEGVGALGNTFRLKWNYSRDNGLFAYAMAHTGAGIKPEYVTHVNTETDFWRTTEGLARSYKYYQNHTNLTYNITDSNSTYKIYDVYIEEDVDNRITGHWKNPITFEFNLNELDLNSTNVIAHLEENDARLVDLTGIDRMNENYSYGYQYDDDTDILYYSINVSDGDQIILQGVLENLPNVTVNSPLNETTGVPIPGISNITVYDRDGETLNVTLYSPTTEETLRTWTGISNNTELLYYWNNLTSNTSYTWYVNVSDGRLTTQSKTYNFTTVEEIDDCLNLDNINKTYIYENTTLCTDTYYMNVSASTGAIIINDNNFTLDCNDSIIYGNNSGYGIHLTTKYNSTIKNCVIRNYTTGIVLQTFSQNNTLLNNIIFNCSQSGVQGTASVQSNIFTNNTIHSNDYGIYFIAANMFNNITGNNITDNSVEGIRFHIGSPNNLVYNNYFANNTAHIGEVSANYWNTTKTLTTNIVGGPYIGGNYFDDYTGSDTDGDQIGDTNTPYDTGVVNGDYLPLILKAPIVTSGGPSGSITGSTQILTATTDEIASCRYSQILGTSYYDMASSTTSAGTEHSWTITTSPDTYIYYVRCNDPYGNVATTDYTISFTVISSSLPSGGIITPVTEEQEQFDPSETEEIITEIPEPGTVIEPGEAGISVQLSEDVFINLFGGTAEFGMIKKIEDPNQYKVVACYQGTLTSYDINVTGTSDKYLCIGEDLTQELTNIKVYKFLEEWIPLETSKHNGKYCAKIESTPYMIAGFKTSASQNQALETIQSANKTLEEARFKGKDISICKELLDEALDEYWNCDYTLATQTANQARACAGEVIIPLKIFAPIVIVGLGGSLFYLRLIRKVKPKHKLKKKKR